MDRSAKVFEILLYECLEKAAATIRSDREIPVAPIIEDVSGRLTIMLAEIVQAGLRIVPWNAPGEIDLAAIVGRAPV